MTEMPVIRWKACKTLDGCGTVIHATAEGFHLRSGAAERGTMKTIIYSFSEYIHGCANAQEVFAENSLPERFLFGHAPPVGQVIIQACPFTFRISPFRKRVPA